MITSKINGKRVFSIGLMLTVLTAAVIWQLNAQEGQAQSTGGFNSLILNVKLPSGVTPATIAGKLGDPTSTFSVQADDVTTPDGESAGTMRIWGVSKNGIATVNINFDLQPFNGMLAAQGTLFGVDVDALHGADVIAVTGGAGTFRGANGEVLIGRNADGSLRICFIETRRR